MNTSRLPGKHPGVYLPVIARRDLVQVWTCEANFAEAIPHFSGQASRVSFVEACPREIAIPRASGQAVAKAASQ